MAPPFIPNTGPSEGSLNANTTFFFNLFNPSAIAIDIVVFPYKFEENTDFIKRVIGLPGEKVRIDKEGHIYINGEVLDEHYGKAVIIDPGRAEKEITLGSDEYFVLGDNRNNSTDSRDPFVGNIQKSDFIGKAFLRIWPLDKICFIKHQ